jgi:hypothetical protein
VCVCGFFSYSLHFDREKKKTEIVLALLLTIKNPVMVSCKDDGEKKRNDDFAQSRRNYL